MTNPEHVNIANQGTDAILEWRKFNPDIIFDLREADLSRVDLSGADLSRANLIETNLSYANLSRTNLSYANMADANLYNANLAHANLSRATLSYANFSRTNLNCTILEKASIHATVWGNLDLSQALQLDTVKHHGPSTLGIDTLMKSKAQIPKEFLRGCGLSDDFISYIPSHFANSGIDFYSCFISYSHKDKSFAHWLHDALQERGIRCWLDDHQILPGDDIYRSIDHGIRVYDKILLCASENSLTSGWVDDEIEHTFAKEKELFNIRKKQVLSLIPLNLDGFLFEGWEHPKRNLIQKRFAADFIGWESNNAKFEEQFERIVKALQTNDAGRELSPIRKL